MRNVSRLIVGVCSAATLTIAAPSAEAAATCSFDPVAGVMVVEFTGQTTVRPQLARIMVDNVPCGAASLTTVDTIRITGSGNLDFNMRAQPFAPGRTPEENGVSEIEVDIQITGGAVRLFLDSTSNQLDLDGRRAIDFFGDGDLDDFTMTGVSRVAISAGAGDDLIDGGDDGIDEMDGGAGNDVLRSGRSMSGGDGDDILIAGPLPAGFSDGPGDDISIGGPFGDLYVADQTANGADQFIGGGGVDIVDYSQRTIAVQIALDGSSESGEMSGGVPIEGDRIAADVENAAGTAGDDILIGNDLPNRLACREGNDLATGVGGADILDGGAGDDDLDGGDGDDDLLGLAGNDFLDGGAGNDFLNGQDGDDDMAGGDGDDLMFGFNGNDTFLGGPGNDELWGGSGNDRIEGGDGRDNYRGQQGDDHIEAPSDGIFEDLHCGGGLDTFVAGPEDRVDDGCLP